MQAEIVSRPRAARPGRARALIVATRAFCEAVTFTLAAAFVHLVAVGREPIPLWSTVLGLFGVTLVLTAVLRERGTVRQSATLTVVVIAAIVAWGLAQPARDADAFAVLSRIVGFMVVGEAYLWRALGIARGLQRWREIRNAALLSLGAIVAASLLPGEIERGPLPALALAVSVSGAVALSLARSTEELALFGGRLRGAPESGSATGTAFAIGLLAVLVAFALPAAQRLLADVMAVIGPPLGELVFLLLLPIGYVAAYLVYFVIWLRDTFGIGGAFEFAPRLGSGIAVDEQRRLEEVEQMRPYVFGAVEIIVALVAVAVAIALIARLVQEKRAALPEGVSLERDSVEGIGLRATLATLLPRRGPARRVAPDDGTRAAAVRRLYWRLLELAERGGPGWRHSAETPAEHERRLLGAGERWRPAEVVVRAFESVRYGEREPDERTLADARDALRRVESGA